MSRLRFLAQLAGLLLTLNLPWTAFPRLYALFILLLLGLAGRLDARRSWLGLANPRVRYHAWRQPPAPRRTSQRAERPESVVC